MLCTSNIAIRMQYSAAYCDYHVILWVTLLATLRHVVGRLSRDNPRLRRYLSFDYFRRKEGEPGGKIQHERFNFSSLSFYKEEKETLFVVTLKSRSQMLFRKIQKSKNNLLSTSLIIMITLFKSQIVLAEHECSANWGECKSIRGKPEYPEKNLSEQSWEPTNSICVSAINQRGDWKTQSVQYRPRTRLVRGI